MGRDGTTASVADVLTAAFRWGRERHPQAPMAHHTAFANSVSYAVTSVSGGYGGPSMREHYCARLTDRPGELSLEGAVALCEPACYGPLTVEIMAVLADEYCFDDEPSEHQAAIAHLTQAN